jgi:hypothetical protein
MGRLAWEAYVSGAAGRGLLTDRRSAAHEVALQRRRQKWDGHGHEGPGSEHLPGPPPATRAASRG